MNYKNNHIVQLALIITLLSSKEIWCEDSNKIIEGMASVFNELLTREQIKELTKPVNIQANNQIWHTDLAIKLGTFNIHLSYLNRDIIGYVKIIHPSQFDLALSTLNK